MRVAEKRWGEITIKKQGAKKNQFDSTKSFSILDTSFNYDIEEVKSVIEATINLTEKVEYKELMNGLKAIGAVKGCQPYP
ncbi:MAG: hypothetical protein NT131_00015 [Methanomassiliicoccales archaeon]|nr:hypothetical protein [Methanomassiliicoccales archaeon]